MTSCSTHVLDSVLGQPAVGMEIVLSAGDDVVARVKTDVDGRVQFVDDVRAGLHRLTFATGAWFAAADRATFYPSVDISFEVDPEQNHYHVALLLGPYSFTTYRGS